MSLSLGGVPFASCLTKSFFRISKWVWARVLSNYCLCSGTWSTCEFVLPFKSWVFFFPQPSSSPNARGGLQSQSLWVRRPFSWFQIPGLGSPINGSDTFLIGEKLWNCYYFPVCGSSTWGYGSCLYCVPSPPICLTEVSSLHLYVKKIFSANPQVIFRDSCFVNNNFGAPVAGGELRVFYSAILARSLTINVLSCQLLLLPCEPLKGRKAGLIHLYTTSTFLNIQHKVQVQCTFAELTKKWEISFGGGGGRLLWFP